MCVCMFMVSAFFRSVPKFLTQFGISDDPSMQHWHGEHIQDDPSPAAAGGGGGGDSGSVISKYHVSYAGGGPHTRSTQLFIAYDDLPFLGKEPWEVCFVFCSR